MTMSREALQTLRVDSVECQMSFGFKPARGLTRRPRTAAATLIAMCSVLIVLSSR